MSDEKIKVELGAESAPLKQGMDEGAAAVNKSVAEMTAAVKQLTVETATSMKGLQAEIHGAFESVAAAFGKVQSAMFALTAIVAGGETFKEVIDSTVNWNFEAFKLARTLGTTTEQASVMMVALDHIGMTADQFQSASMMMSRRLMQNEDNFKSLGVATRDQEGHYRSTTDIMMDVNDKLATLKEGTDRNGAGLRVYGRAWGEVQQIVLLNAETMKEANKRAEELGLKVGEEGKQQVLEYRLQMRELKLTFDALMMTVGKALLPVLTDLAAWFNSIGPQAVIAFKVAIAEVKSIIDGLVFAFTVMNEYVNSVFAQMTNSVLTLVRAASKALHGDLGGAVDEFKKGLLESDRIARGMMSNIGKAAEQTRDKLKNMWSDALGLSAPKKSKAEPKTGGENFETGQKEEKSRVPQWKSELEEQKLAENAFFKSSLSDTLAYWEEILRTEKLTSKERQEVTHEILQTKKQMLADELSSEIANLKYKQEAAKNDGQARIAIEDQILREIEQFYGKDSKEYSAALKDKERLLREFQQQQIKLAEEALAHQKQLDDISIKMKEEDLNFLKQMGKISDIEELDAKKQLEEDKYNLELQAAIDKAALLEEGTLDQKKALDAIEVMEKEHQLKIQELNHQRTLAVKSSWEQMFSGVTSAIETSIKGLIMGTQTLQRAVATLGQAVISEFVSMGVKKAASWIASEAAMTSATAAGAASRLAIESWAAIQSAAIKVASGLKDILVSAYKAAAGAFAATADIPIVGPIIAPEAGATAFASVLSFAGGVASAAGGWEVPQDQFAMVHKNEMILPANLSDKIRNMTEPGGQMPAIHYAPSINALDKRGVKQVLEAHSRTLVQLLREEMKNNPR